jgi:catechol 2,3-dioxygenase-like lactoylglutathione lyase family enzyme
MPDFLGFDHIDTRVASIAAVEPFYDQLMPMLGLSRKHHAFVDAHGEWGDVKPDGSYNAVEYYEEKEPGRPASFIGFIEDTKMQPSLTRIAFRVAAPLALKEWIARLEQMGARNIQLSDSMEEYSAIFFEDPAGTRLELTTPTVG